MKVGLPRGVTLSKYESQNFEPLMGRLELTAYALPANLFSLEEVRLPFKILTFPDERLFFGRTSLIRKYFTSVRQLRYYMYGLERELRDKDIIHSWEADYAFSYQSARARQKTGAGLVITHWNLLPFAGQTSRLVRQRCQFVRQQTGLFLPVTQLAAKCLLAEGVPEEKMVVLPMGVDQTRFRPADKDPEILRRYGLNPADLVVLFLGRYVREKGIYPLLHAIESLKNRTGGSWERVRYLLVGDGPEKPGMERFIREKGLESLVRIGPPAPYSDVHKLHQAADLFVLPSIATPGVAEQFGYALVESMCCGSAIIVSDCGALPEVGGDAVVVVPSGSAEALADRVAALIESDRERQLCRSRALERARQRYDSRKVAARLLKLYQSLA